MRFINYPTFINPDHYTEAIDVYRKTISIFPEVIGLFTMGTIKSPGLSDIDFIVVVEKNGLSRKCLSPFKLRLDKRLFQHDVFVIYPELIRHFEYIFYATNIRTIFTKSSLLDNFKAVSALPRELKLIYLIDLCRMRIEQIRTDSLRGYCDVKSLITRSSSVIHSVSISNSLNIKLPHSTINFRNKIASVKNKWAAQSIDKIKDPEKIFNYSLKAWTQILESAARLYSNEQTDKSQLKFKNRLFNIYFSNTNRCQYIYKDSGSILRVCIPKSLFYHYAGYIDSKNTIYNVEQKKRLYYVKTHKHFVNEKGYEYSMTGNVGIPITIKEKANVLYNRIKNNSAYYYLFR